MLAARLAAAGGLPALPSMFASWGGAHRTRSEGSSLARPHTVGAVERLRLRPPATSSAALRLPRLPVAARPHRLPVWVFSLAAGAPQLGLRRPNWRAIWGYLGGLMDPATDQPIVFRRGSSQREPLGWASGHWPARG